MVNIKIKSSDWAKIFVQNMSKLPCDVNLYYGQQVFDAKSILAILSLDFSKIYGVDVITHSEEVYKQFKEYIKDFEVKNV